MINHSLSNLSLQQLTRAVSIREQIDALQQQLAELLGGTVAAPAKGRRGPRKMSASARARIGAAQKLRWAKLRRGKPAPAAKAASKGRRKMSAAGRARLVRSLKARWAAARAAGRSRLTAA